MLVLLARLMYDSSITSHCQCMYCNIQQFTQPRLTNQIEADSHMTCGAFMHINISNM